MGARRSWWPVWLGLALLLAACAPATGAGLTPTSARYLPHVRRDPTATPTLTPPATYTPTATPSLVPETDLMMPVFWWIRYDGCPWTDGGEITVKVRNQGAVPAGPFDTGVNGLIGRLDGLAAGETADLTLTFTGGPVGGVIAEADVNDEVPEWDEDNNGFYIVFTPPPPCDTPRPPATPTLSPAS